MPYVAECVEEERIVRAIVGMWNAGLDTLDMADLLNMPEFRVFRILRMVRDVAAQCASSDGAQAQALACAEVPSERRP